MKFRAKVLLILLAAVGVTGGLILWRHHQDASDLAFSLIQEKVLAITVTAAPKIDGDVHERITDISHDLNEDYRAVQKVLRDTLKANQSGDLPLRFVYTYRPVDADGKKWIYVVDAEPDDSDEKSSIGEEVELDDYDDEVGIFPKVNKADVDIEFFTDSYGTWLSAWAPIKNSKGENVALLGVDIKADAVEAKLNNLLYAGLATLAIAIILVSVVSVFFARKVTAPLGTLGEGVTRIGQGDLKTKVTVETDDEFGVLAKAINQMAEGLQEREAFKGALLRFVSTGATDTVVDETSGADAGEGSKRKVTVMVAEIQNFAEVSKTLSPDKLIGFVSDWYAATVENMLEYRGSLEKSESEAVTVTFGAPLEDNQQERHAVEAALSLQQSLKELRRRWEISADAELSLGAVIHTGNVTIAKQEDVRVMEYASLARIIEAVSIIREAKGKEIGGIIISEVAAEGLKGAIPVNYLRSIELPGTGELLGLHTVAMQLTPA